MPSELVYLMPDYYPDFSCKMGACRTSCCEGWRVSVSEEDYFRLVGMECSPEIRKRLDCALHLLKSVSPDEYAEICHDYEGNCKLRMPDGRCFIQAELGEEALPLICKLYPRGYRNEGHPECSCADSCERTVEILFHHKAPLTFIRRKAEFNVPVPETPTEFSEHIPGEEELRLSLISLLQDRTLPLWKRIFRLGLTSERISETLKKGETPDLAKTLTELDRKKFEEKAPDHSMLETGVCAIEKMIDAMDRHGGTLNRYGKELLAYFAEGDPLEKYESAVARFSALYPEWEIGFENLLVNHLFFTHFPFADEKMSAIDQCLALAMVYTSIRFLAIGWTVEHGKEEDLVDILSAAFRLIEHSPFHPYAASLMHREHFDTHETILALLRL